MAETRGTIVCRLCGEGIPVVFRRTDGNGVQLAVTNSEPLATHYAACPNMQQPGTSAVLWKPETPTPELVGRIHRLLDTGAYLSTAGSRACTMCGTTGAECLDLARKTGPTGGHPVGPSCCGACRDGNTHPAPQEGMACAEWAEAREAGA